MMRILTAGARLADRYTLIRQLGAGGNADVWLASDDRTEARVALKLLRLDATADSAQTALLKREWRIGARLMHAHIVRIFEFHDDAAGPFYSLQYVGATDIGVLTGAPLFDSLRPISMIADALRYAHGKGVVHHDIKATNILLDSRGLPYLADFGVAADSDDPIEISGGGSPVASSPEQVEGGAATTGDDIFALGVLIHELATGSPPRDGEISRELADGTGSAMPESVQMLLHDMLATSAARPNAETVAARLAAAGYAAGPASAKYVLGEAVDAEALQSVAAKPIQRRQYQATSDPVVPATTMDGITPRTLYAGLAGALLLLLSVVFVLPKLFVEEGSQRSVDSGFSAEFGTASDESQEGTGVEAATDTVSQTAQREVPVRSGGSSTGFSENIEDGGPASVTQLKAQTDVALGNLLSQLERLRYRAIDRWGGQDYLDAVNVYADGDQAYIDRNYRLAGERYRQASKLLVPFFGQLDEVFGKTLAAARSAFEVSDISEAIRLFDLATSITPGHREAEAGFVRAKNLQSVLTLMSQGEQLENDLELDAALSAYEKATALDALWQPTATAVERVKAAINQFSFEQRMTEGFDALFTRDFPSARAAFNAAKALDPKSQQPEDGLLQLDQEIRLSQIRQLEAEALQLDSAEQWEASIVVYEDTLKIDPDLQFALTGLAVANSRARLHGRLADLIADPDTLSDQVNIRKATSLLLDVTKISAIGPRLNDQKIELSRLLKRAATPLQVQLLSDNLTNVAIFKVGKFGTFDQYNIDLRPGVYVAVGNRSGYRDVRIEFRVAPEVEMKPVLIQCEESI
jgi:hypothetical protein